MAQKILVAFDDSQNALRAVDFIIQYFAPHHRVTLFSVLPDTATLCDMNSPALTPYFKSEQQNFCLLEDQKKKLVLDAMEAARQKLTAAGFAEDRISVKAEPKKHGIARDIVTEAATGYDVIVVGRRGVSAIKDFLMGSISQKVLYLAKDVSVIVVN